MSSTARAARVAPAVRPGTTPALKAVPSRAASRASSATFALFVGAVLTLGLLGLLALNTLLAQGAFATGDLAKKQAVLADRAEALQQEVALLEAPAQLAAAAQQLGMVGTKNPVFLDPVTGKILGVPLAGAYPAPKVTPAPGAATTPATGATATPGAKPSKAATAPTTKPGAKPSGAPVKPPAGH